MTAAPTTRPVATGMIEIRRAVRPHNCWICNRQIEVGEIYERRSQRIDGRIVSAKIHRTCPEVAAVLSLAAEPRESLPSAAGQANVWEPEKLARDMANAMPSSPPPPRPYQEHGPVKEFGGGRAERFAAKLISVLFAVAVTGALIMAAVLLMRGVLS